jgi:hypothetical protein
MSFITILKQADIFYELTNTQLELVASICSEKTYQEGEAIFEENTPGNQLYVIAAGEVGIQVNSALVSKDQKGEAFTICHPPARAVLRRNFARGRRLAFGWRAQRPGRYPPHYHPA